MSDCFVCCRSQDQALVLPVVAALRRAGLSVEWERDLPAAQRTAEGVDRAVDAASCVVVCWTEGSVAPEGARVRRLAGRARKRGVMVPVLAAPVAPPPGFDQDRPLDLSAWRGGADDPVWQHFLYTVREVAKAHPPAPARPAARSWNWRHVGAGASAVALVVGLINGFILLPGNVCKFESFKPVCRLMGVGDLPSQDEEDAWQRASRGVNGEGYRDYLRRWPQGHFVQAAQARLQACDLDTESWQPGERRFPLVLNADLHPRRDETSARASLRARLEQEASQHCRTLEEGGTHRILGAEPDPAGWQCSQSDSGWRCGFDGHTICRFQARVVTKRWACDTL